MSNKTIILSTLEKAINTSYQSLILHLNERSSRIWAATEANRYGRGGISAVHRATGIDYKTISKGLKELLRTTQKFIQQLQMQKSYFQLYPWKACILQKIDQPYI